MVGCVVAEAHSLDVFRHEDWGCVLGCVWGGVYHWEEVSDEWVEGWFGGVRVGEFVE